jgi:hypothetical protein
MVDDDSDDDADIAGVVGAFDSVWDRACFVAISPDTRPEVK